MSGQRILVVDDDADIRALLRELLERRGFSVTEAADGRQALQELYGRRPDLVLLDVGMPGMDGWTTLERIRELSDVPVVMLTARSAERAVSITTGTSLSSRMRSSVVQPSIPGMPTSRSTRSGR